MQSPPTLTFGDDGSPASDVGWLWINSHAWPGWRLEIITAHMPPVGPPPTPEDATLHHWDPPVARAPFAEAEFHEIENLTASIDPRLALWRPTDLLVIGPRGPGLLKALHLGSTAEWLLQHPVTPLLIARSGHPVRSLIAGHDGSPHAQHTIRRLTQLPWIGGVEITVLIVNDGRTNVDTATAMARDEFATIDIEPEIVVRDGKPTAVIFEAIEQRAPDLVALGTRGLTGLKRLSYGSTAGAIARAAKCSVFLASEETPPTTSRSQP